MSIENKLMVYSIIIYLILPLKQQKDTEMPIN